MKKLFVIKMILVGIVAVSAFSYVVMLLWNALIPDIFHGPSLGFFQAAGLLVLSKILFHGMWSWRRGHHTAHYRWRERMQEKMNAMTPEERDQFRQQWKQRCGHHWKWNQGNTEQPETKVPA